MEIKNLRLEKGILQKYIAKQLGYNLKRYQRIENGTAKLSITKAKKLAELLGCELSKILDSEEIKSNEQM